MTARHKPTPAIYYPLAIIFKELTIIFSMRWKRENNNLMLTVVTGIGLFDSGTILSSRDWGSNPTSSAPNTGFTVLIYKITFQLFSSNHDTVN